MLTDGRFNSHLSFYIYIATARVSTPRMLLYNRIVEGQSLGVLTATRAVNNLIDRVSNANHCSQPKVIYWTDFFLFFDEDQLCRGDAEEAILWRPEQKLCQMKNLYRGRRETRGATAPPVLSIPSAAPLALMGPSSSAPAGWWSWPTGLGYGRMTGWPPSCGHTRHRYTGSRDPRHHCSVGWSW